MVLVILVGVPVGAVLVAGIVLHFLDSAWVVRVSNAAIGAQVVAALIAFTLPRTMPTNQTYEGEICPDLDSGQGHVMVAIAVASIATGAGRHRGIVHRRPPPRSPATSPPRRNSRRPPHACDSRATGRRWVVRLLRLTSVGGRGLRHQPRSHAPGMAHTPITGR